MTENVAWTILISIASAAAVFWVLTTTWFIKLVRESKTGHRPERVGMADDFPDDRAVGGLSGSQQVKGRPDELAPKLAADLGRHGLAGAPVKVLGVDRTTVRFEVMGPSGAGQGQGLSFGGPKKGEVDFRPSKGDESRAEYHLEPGASRGLLVAGGIVSALGLVVLVGGFWVLGTYVVPNPRPAVRGQVIQMIQCVHLLWPPWLLGILYKRMNTAQLQVLSSRIANLPYL